jgi:carbonic anhydrase
MDGFSRNIDELVINLELETHIEIGPVLQSEIIETGSGLAYNALVGAGSIAFILSEANEKIFLARFLGFYIHAPSEHTFNGVHRDVELQMVYQDYQTFEFFIVAVMFDTAAGGSDYNSFIDSLNLDASSSKIITPGINFYKLEESIVTKDFFTYEGSFTIPPCTEGVRWIVITKSVHISKD